MKNKKQILMMVVLAVLSALVVVFTYVPIKLGQFQLNLVLVFIAVGAIMYGPFAGAYLGALNGVFILLNGDASWFLGLNALGTVLTVILKTGLAGLAAGFVYKLLKKYNQYVAVILAALVCPIINSGLFVLGCLTFFVDAMSEGASASDQSTLGYILVSMVGVNFFIEVAVTSVLSPTIAKVSLYGIKKFNLDGSATKNNDNQEETKAIEEKPDFETVDATVDEE